MFGCSSRSCFRDMSRENIEAVRLNKSSGVWAAGPMQDNAEQDMLGRLSAALFFASCWLRARHVDNFLLTM
jgi:hypothetical protein